MSIRWSRLISLVAVCIVAAVYMGPAQGSVAGTSRHGAAAFRGRWSGHDRYLRIGRDRVGHERVYAGCCDHVVDVTFRLRHMRGTRAKGSARARVLRVHVFDSSAYGASNPAPHVGEKGIVRLRHGVLFEPFTGMPYCDRRADRAGTCGA